MAEPDAAATMESAAATAAAADATGPRRRRGPAEVQEVVDELAIETKRTTLLDRLEGQVKDHFHCSRMIIALTIADDKKVQTLVESEFKDWRDKQERRAELAGVLVFTAQGALQFLEGPTELLFGSLQLFQKLTVDQPPAIGGLRVIHFTELHGVRSCVSWCTYVHTAKLQGGTQVNIEESACADFVFKVYQKFLLVCLRVKEQVGGDDDEEPDSETVQSTLRKIPADTMPSVEEAYALLSKSTADFFFSYPEFEKVFMAPFQMVLHSELLWPMSPPLVY